LDQNWKSWPPEAQLELLESLKRRQSSSKTFQKTYRSDRVAFTHDCIDWRDDRPTEYHDEINAALDTHRRVSVRGPHGLGKTAIASINILHFALTHDGDDWKIPTTASAWRQLTTFLWPEIHKWSHRLRWDKVGRNPFTQYELQSQLIKLSTGRAFAMASSDDEFTEGAHADHLLYVFDEAKAIPAGRWDAAEGALMTGDTYALAISTPGEPVGRFYDIQTRKPGYEDWHVIHVTLERCIAAGRITQAQAEQRAMQWGEQSAVYQNRVLGQFCASDEDCVVPLSWIEAANERWLDRIELLENSWNWADGARRCVWPRWTWAQHADTPSLDAIGIDIARSDLGDKTVIARRQGSTLTQLDRYHIADTQPIVGYASNLMSKSPKANAIVDIIGIGSGPYDQLRERFGARAISFNASETSEAKDRSGELQFANKRAYAWWNFRELLDPAFNSEIALPPDDTLIGDLTAPHRGKSEGKDLMTSSGKILIESKKDIRKRIGRSTDDGDAVVMAFFPKKKEPRDDGAESYSWDDY